MSLGPFSRRRLLRSASVAGGRAASARRGRCSAGSAKGCGADLDRETTGLVPMAMSAHCQTGIAPPEIPLTRMFKGVMPFLFVVFVPVALVHILPEPVFHLPQVFHGR